EALLDDELIAAARGALVHERAVTLERTVTNADRAVGALLSGTVARRRGARGLPEGSIEVTFTGSAGQSFGAFLPKGITLRLLGDANDYVGKGLSGGRLTVRPPLEVHEDFVAEDNVIAGNVILYGATGGEAFLRGVVGERFAVRNSGATAVVEGVGDHGCEYMTGGRVVVLGPTGRNFGAGMSGGIAYVWDPDRALSGLLNREMVELETLDDLDRNWLVGTVFRHQEATGSEVAGRLLTDWQFSVDQFAKVMPRDYKRVLLAIKAAEQSGRDIDEAIMAAAKG
ncbi:MAG TPA: glutamate synthase subunit alpha, partial [Acidimicrobiales bacterium]|nr:glutamate synthase subunit alpha [Acidimicrobiales bacterium]